MSQIPNRNDNDYIQGQIESLRALILGLAQMQSKHEFRAQSIERLETLKTALLSQPVPDNNILAVDDCIKWVLNVTDSA